MDAIDNLIFATRIFNNVTTGSGSTDSKFHLAHHTPFKSSFIDEPNFNGYAIGSVAPVGMANNVFGFSAEDKQDFVGYYDVDVLEKAITQHWYDINGNRTYQDNTSKCSDFTNTSTYHLIFAYLIENTKILEIFSEIVKRYLSDEELGISSDPRVVNWILNSERLFFRSNSHTFQTHISKLRPHFSHIRRNAYHRLLGMDLASNFESEGYNKPRITNQQFVPIFERYLSEIWDGYINASNTSGPNTRDVNGIIELATQLKEMLEARRGGPKDGAGIHSIRNITREEYSSVILMSWFSFIISFDSEVVKFLNCQSSTIGERLAKIGKKVGITPHSKSQAIFEMAGSATNILSTLEVGGVLDNLAFVTAMLSSLDPAKPPTLERDYMNTFLTVINNWEKATGHKIKHRQADVRGSVRVENFANGIGF